MANHTKKTCQLAEPCSVLNISQWIYCVVRHGELEFAVVAHRARITLRRLAELARGDKRPRLEEVARLIKATGREVDGIEILLTEFGLADRLVVVRRTDSSDTDSIAKEMLEATAAHGDLAAYCLPDRLRTSDQVDEAISRVAREEKELADVRHALEARRRQFEHRRPMAMGA